jgi:hypothetical protein
MTKKPTVQDSNIEQPEGWKLHSEHGYMRCGPGPADKLVRVADVVLWLMETKELPCRAAVDLVCAELREDAEKNAPALFMLKVADVATGLPSDYSFLKNQSFMFGDGQSMAADCGLPGALKWMVQLWGEHAAPGAGNVFGSHVLDPLAVRFGLAHALWDWGNIKKVVPLQAVPLPSVQADDAKASQPIAAQSKKVPQRELAPQWDGARLRKRHKELKDGGNKAPTNTLSKESGVPIREINRRMAYPNGSIGAMAGQLKSKS